jgi:hypothetical protein
VNERRRTILALAAACVSHVGAIGAIRLAERSAARGAEAAPTTAETIEIDLAPAPEATATNKDEGAASAASAGALAVRGRTTRSTARGVDPLETGIVEAPAGTASAGATPGAPDEPWAPRIARVDLGIDPRKRPAPGVLGLDPAPAPEPASTTGGVTEALDEHDVALGLGRGGAVRSAVEDAAQASSAMGSATFEIGIDSGGRVSVAVFQATDARWAGLSDAIRADVEKRRAQIRLPPGARGLRVTVRAEAKEQFPDGRTPQSMGTRVEARPGRVHETKDHVDITPPSVALAHRGKVCNAELELGITGPRLQGGCSLENAGTHPVRIVAARILRESRM